MMNVDVASYSALGKRSNNEDAFFASCGEQAFLAIVCDGVGGSEGGEVASQCAVQLLSSRLLHKYPDVDDLEDAIIAANGAVRAIEAVEDGPKTTVALLWMTDEKAIAANVGDSRIYQFRDGQILFQSKDHSVPQLAVIAGEITRDQIRDHKDRNQITRCLGLDGPVKVDRKRLSVSPGDRFLLCSDGFWEPVLETDMLRTAVRCDSAEDWLEEMRKIAVSKEKDNHTAVAMIIR